MSDPLASTYRPGRATGAAGAAIVDAGGRSGATAVDARAPAPSARPTVEGMSSFVEGAPARGAYVPAPPLHGDGDARGGAAGALGGWGDASGGRGGADSDRASPLKLVHERMRIPQDGGHGLKTKTMFYEDRDGDMGSLLFGSSPRRADAASTSPRPQKRDSEHYEAGELRSALARVEEGVAPKVGVSVPWEDDDFESRQLAAQRWRTRGTPAYAAPFARDTDDALYAAAEEAEAAVPAQRLGAGARHSPKKALGKGRGEVRQAATTDVVSHVTDGTRDADTLSVALKVGAQPATQDEYNAAHKEAAARAHALRSTDRSGHGALWDAQLATKGARDRDVTQIVAKVGQGGATARVGGGGSGAVGGDDARDALVREATARAEQMETVRARNRGRALWGPGLGGEKDKDAVVGKVGVAPAQPEDALSREERLATARRAQQRNRGTRLW